MEGPRQIRSMAACSRSGCSVEGIDPAQVAGARPGQVVALGGTDRGRGARAQEPRGPLPRAAGGAMNADPRHRSLDRQRGGAAKLVLVFVAITVVMVGLSAWGFYRLSHTNSITSGESARRPAAGADPVHVHVQLRRRPERLGDRRRRRSRRRSSRACCRRWSPARSGAARSCSASGSASPPCSRATPVVVAALEMAVVDWVSGFLPPNPVAVGVYLFAEGACCSPWSLLSAPGCRRSPPGVIGVALFGAGMAGRSRRRARHDFNIGALRTVGQVGRSCCRPTGSGTPPSTTSSRPRSSPNT